MDKTPQFDRYDRMILDILQQDGRISNQELAERINLSPSPCLRRLRTLEESGVILGYRALLDAKALGLSLMALINVSMNNHAPHHFPPFEDNIMAMPEILECLQITGQGADYQLKVVVPDMETYQNLLLNKIARIEGVASVHSTFVLRSVVNKTSLPVSENL
jgi:Lrp/AsnC family leucine-responsive transcriptional regulator